MTKNNVYLQELANFDLCTNVNNSVVVYKSYNIYEDNIWHKLYIKI